MKVKVEYLGYIRNMLKKRVEEIELQENALLSELLTLLSNKYGAKFRKEVYEPGLKDLKYGFGATVNGVLTRQLGGINIKLKDGDHIILMSLISGG